MCSCVRVAAVQRSVGPVDRVVEIVVASTKGTYRSTSHAKTTGAARNLNVAEVILTCPWMAKSMSLSELLSSQRRWGSARSHKCLRSVGLSEIKLVSELTERQRVALTCVLEASRHSREERARGQPR